MTLAKIKSEIDELASKINAPEELLPTYGVMGWECHPFIEINDLGWMYYVISQRGHREEKLATDLDHLLYMAFRNITSGMAIYYELNNRIEDKDHRRIIFAKQEELLGILNESWRLREIEEHKKILHHYPFDDLAGLRATLAGELRKQRYSAQEITKLIYEKYPSQK